LSKSKYQGIGVQPVSVSVSVPAAVVLVPPMSAVVACVLASPVLLAGCAVVSAAVVGSGPAVLAAAVLAAALVLPVAVAGAPASVKHAPRRTSASAGDRAGIVGDDTASEAGLATPGEEAQGRAGRADGPWTCP